MLVSDAVDPYTLSNFFPRSTGLPVTVWAEVGGLPGVRPRLLISDQELEHGWPEHFLVVDLDTETMADPLPVESERAVLSWVRRNKAALLAHWTGEFDSMDLARAVRPA